MVNALLVFCKKGLFIELMICLSSFISHSYIFTASSYLDEKRVFVFFLKKQNQIDIINVTMKIGGGKVLKYFYFKNTAKKTG